MTPTSGIEFFVWPLIAAAIIAMFAKRLRIPYTASLVFGGLLLGISRIPILSPPQPGHRPDWLTPNVDKRLSLIMEGESLLNDGTAVVLFGILFGAVAAEKSSAPAYVGQYVLAVAGGAILGSVLGYLASRITGTVDDPEIEITLTTILAYGSYLLAHHLHLSGVIATAAAGLVLGNFGSR